MRSINVKKLAALAVGAMFAGQAYAAGIVDTNSLPTDKGWYLESAIVIGAAAQPADVVWAGNIAAAIGQMAFEKETQTVSADLGAARVKLKTPGKIVVGGQGYHYDDAQLSYKQSEFNDLELGKSKIPTLKENEDITIKYRGSKDESWNEDTASYTQKIIVPAGSIDIDSYVDNSKATLKMIISDEQVKFRTEIKSLDMQTGTYSVDNSTLKDFEFDILGQTYEVTALSVDDGGDGYINIATYVKKTTVPVGGTVEFEGYTIKVVMTGGEDKPWAVLELYDDQGNKIATDKVNENEDADFDPISVRTGDIVPGENGWVELKLKSDSTKISLTGGTGTKTDFPEDDWELKVSVSLDSGKITSMTFDVVYKDSKYDDAEHGLEAGEVFKFPGPGGYGIVFAGLTTEPMHSFEIEDDTIKALDKDGDPFTVKLVDRKSAGRDFNDGDTKIYTFDDFLNGKDIGVKIEYDDTNGTLGDGDDKITIYVDYDYSGDEEEFSPDGQVTMTLDGTTKISNPIDIDVTDQDDLSLRVAVTNPNGDEVNTITKNDYIYLLFNSNNVATPDKDSPYKLEVNWSGRDTAPADFDRIPVKLETLNSPTTTEYDDIAIPFRVEKGKFDFKELKLGNEGDDVQVTLEDGVTTTLDADSDSDKVPDTGLLVNGTEVYVENDKVTVKVPEDIRKVDVFFGVPAHTEEGEEYITVGKGDTIPGTGYVVEGIEAEGASTTVTTYKPIEDWNPERVYLDTKLPNTYDKVIVVGGYLVNTVAEMLAGEYNELKEIDTAGEYIVKKFDKDDKEYIVVFGYTAEDTGTAAHEFISWLKENVMKEGA